MSSGPGQTGARAATRPEVVIFGDEVTAGFDPADPLRCFPPRSRYYAGLEAAYELVVDADRARPLLVAGSPEICLARFRKLLDEHPRAACVVVQLGTRDLVAADYGADVVNGLSFFVEHCRSRGLRCVLIGHPGVRASALPVDLGTSQRSVDAARERQTRVSREYLALLPGLGCALLDLRDHPEFLGADGLHFTLECQEALGRLLAERVGAALRE